MPKKLLLVDTNIISRAQTPTQIDCYVNLFKELEKTYRFGVTRFTEYEQMRSSDKAHRAAIEEYLAQNMVTIDLSDILMKFAARLYYVYSKDPLTKGLKISDGDIINAAYAIAKDCAVLTIDSNDFPRPFFTEVSPHEMHYTSRSRKEAIDVAFIVRPAMALIKDRFATHDI